MQFYDQNHLVQEKLVFADMLAVNNEYGIKRR